MIFLDYTFELLNKTDIAFDRELTLDRLGLKEGDKFQLTIIDNRIVLKKYETSAN